MAEYNNKEECLYQNLTDAKCTDELRDRCMSLAAAGENDSDLWIFQPGIRPETGRASRMKTRIHAACQKRTGIRSPRTLRARSRKDPTRDPAALSQIRSSRKRIMAASRNGTCCAVPQHPPGSACRLKSGLLPDPARFRGILYGSVPPLPSGSILFR